MLKSKAVLAVAAAVVSLALVSGPVLSAGAAPNAAPGIKPLPGQPHPTTDPSAPGISIARGSFDLPDPFLLAHGGKYYMYLSTAFGNDTQHVPELTGRPGHWSRNSIDAVPELPPWAIGDPEPTSLTWSPSVYELDGLYVMYFAAQVRDSNPTQHCIAIAFSRDPAGPFDASPVPFVCQQSLGGDIDPQMFVDPHGPDGPDQPNYLIWKSDNNSTPGDGPATIWAQGLSNDGLFLVGQPTAIFQGTKSWELPLAEAPQMALSPTSTVWLFFSAGTGFFSPDYGMGAARCAGPLGPCTDVLPGPLLASNDQGSGPGEETYFVGPDGSDWLLYSPIHAGDPFEVYRPIEAARIGWSARGPYVAAAGTFPSPVTCSGKAQAPSGGCSR
jgi:hypothetical protein